MKEIKKKYLKKRNIAVFFFFLSFIPFISFLRISSFCQRREKKRISIHCKRNARVPSNHPAFSIQAPRVSGVILYVTISRLYFTEHNSIAAIFKILKMQKKVPHIKVADDFEECFKGDQKSFCTALYTHVQSHVRFEAEEIVKIFYPRKSVSSFLVV